MILITPLPGVTTTKPGSATFPFPGVGADVVDANGESVPWGGGGYLVLTRPWPAMLRGIYGDPERYRATYWSRFPGKYFAGDGAKRDEEGYFWLLGRVDDVMNVAGHRISTIEVESALVDHPAVAEAAVVGRADPISGQAIFAFVILRIGFEPTDELAAEVREHVGKVISPIAKPKYLLFTPDLPKTRSGKIMRRLLRDIGEGRAARRHDDACRRGRGRDDPRAEWRRDRRGVAREAQQRPRGPDTRRLARAWRVDDFGRGHAASGQVFRHVYLNRTYGAPPEPLVDRSAAEEAAIGAANAVA